jgi:neuronal growth regulator 1
MMNVFVALVALLLPLALGQRTPTISYITSPDIFAKIGGTIEMDCSVLYATEYPVLWVKLPGHCDHVRNNDIRNDVADTCTPIPLSSGSALIVRDNRFR